MQLLKLFVIFLTICVIPFEIVVASKGKWYPSKDGLRYYIDDDEQFTWLGALHECARLGLQLVVIDTAEKNKDLLGVLRFSFGEHGRRNLWLGGNDKFNKAKTTKRPFFWAPTGQQFTFTYWSEGNPDNSPLNINNYEHCALIYDGGLDYQWNDSNCNRKFGFICEETKFLKDCQIYLNATNRALKQLHLY